ncbi:putative heterokaryon incompatibility [Colletotrichum asianum]
MEDDLGKTGLPPLGVEDIEKMKDLWKFSIRRSAAQAWAYRDIKFLVYDDTDDEMKGGTDDEQPFYDSEDEAATLQRAIEMSLETEHKSPEEPSQHTETGPSDQRQSPNDHKPSGGCAICCNVPEFPYTRKARTFRLISPASLYPDRDLEQIPLCTHYVAVSYCWPEPIFDDQGQLLKTPVESKVRDLDGTVRDARALDDVLDRAVDFANCVGLRMIWIDQECLPQPTDQSPDEEKEYQQLGVQAMDLVYNRACVTVGLHAGTIVDQNQVNALPNMCDYDIRLHTVLIAQHCTSLRFAMLTLALLNGDRSLLVPEVYSLNGSNNIGEEEICYAGLGLLSPFDINPGAIHDYSMLQQGPLAPRASVHAFRDTVTQGLPLPAYIWIVDRELDLSPVKEQLAETWHAMKSLHIIVTRAKDESLAAFMSREGAAKRHFRNPTIMNKALGEILQHGHVPQDSTVWCGMDPTGINCTADIKIASLEADPAAKRKLAGIIIYILAYLHKLARQDPQATGVANSIWQSLRVDYTKEGKVGSNELPDVVCDELFTHIDVLLDSSSTLQLHRGSGNAYLQLWFIDRIMQRGTLWIGRYQRVRDTSKLPNTQSSSSRGKEPDRELNKKDEISNDPQGSASAVSAQISRGATESILQRQGTRRMFARLADRALFESDNKEPTSILVNIGSLYYFADAAHRGTWDAEADEARARDLVSVFDVDGPCIMATPFNAEWETLPNPALRSMSACWVVELLDRRAFSRMSEQEPEGKGKGKDEVNAGNGGFEAARNLMPAEDTPLYRVLHKVRGLWQLMDIPLGEILFI